MNLVFTGLGHLLSVIEIVIVMDFLNACLEWKNDITYKKSANIGMGFVLYLISQCNGRFQGSEIVVIIIDIIILFIFCTAFFEATLRYKVLCCICPFFVITVSTILLMQIMAIITENSVIFHISNVSYHLMTGAVLSKIILWYVLRKLKKLFKSSVLYLTSSQFFIINILAAFTVVVELGLFYVINLEIANGMVIIILITISIGMILLSGWMIYSMFMISRQNKELLRYKIISIENQEKETQIKELHRSDLRIRQLRHDYKNHLLSMQELLKSREYIKLGEYLEEITGCYLSKGNGIVETKGSIINAVMNTKIFQCQEKGIDISSQVVGSMEDIDCMEIGIILFNLLDNAIEACEHNCRLKEIKCGIYRDIHELNIFVKNSIDKSVLGKNPNLETTKENKEHHGLGCVIVKEIVEKKKGLLEFYEEKNIFCVHIYLPLE